MQYMFRPDNYDDNKIQANVEKKEVDDVTYEDWKFEQEYQPVAPMVLRED